VLIHFDGESKSLKKPTYDASSRTLTLYYPANQYRVLVDLLRNEKVYCQFLSYANGHVWADVHTGSVRAR
jgi:phosphoglycerol transferase MdoB-like AlkP superfamily enzyme